MEALMKDLSGDIKAMARENEQLRKKLESQIESSADLPGSAPSGNNVVVRGQESERPIVRMSLPVELMEDHARAQAPPQAATAPLPKRAGLLARPSASQPGGADASYSDVEYEYEYEYEDSKAAGGKEQGGDESYEYE